MGSMFPVGAGIGRIRAIIEIIKEFGGSIELSRLAEESRYNIDELLPLVEALNQLGLTEVVESEIKITPEGMKFNIKNSTKMVKERLAHLEPFKSAKKIINGEEIRSDELFDELARQGRVLHGDKTTNDTMLKKLLIRWAVRSHLLNYDAETDMWSVEK